MSQQRPSKADIAFCLIVSQEDIDAASAREKSRVSRAVAWVSRIVDRLASAVAFKSGGVITKAEAEKRAFKGIQVRLNPKKGN